MKKLKVGVFGAGRGADLAQNFMMLGCDIVALCDYNPDRVAEGQKLVGTSVAVYDDFDAFIRHKMDAVIIANDFHDHASYVIKCFERGIHVFCECISNGTMAEGVALIRAFEKSNVVYMMAENYPQMIFNREAKRVCDSGTLGKILYAEGEYNHPGDPFDVWFKKTYAYHRKHWRNFLPSTYYITHSLGPVMWVTGATPKRVTAFASFAPNTDENVPVSKHCGDMAALIMTQNDDGSIFRVTGCAAFGGHHNAYRFCGTKGQIENLRGMGDQVMLRYNGWQIPEGAREVQLYEPSWNDKDEMLIKKAGHGGADYLTVRMFCECVSEGRQPEHPFDIYSAVNMSSVALLSHRSVLEGGVPYDIPDFHLEEERVKYQNDYLSPFYGKDGSEPTLPCCSHPDYAPTEKQQELNDRLLKGE